MRIDDHEMDLINTLESLMEKCKKCSKSKWFGEKRFIPLEWNPMSRFLIIADDPNQITESLWHSALKYYFRKELFAIIYLSNCGFPIEDVRHKCMEYIKKFIKLIDPEVIIVMGSFSHNLFLHEYGRISNALVGNYEIELDMRYKIVAAERSWAHYDDVFRKINSILKRDR